MSFNLATILAEQAAETPKKDCLKFLGNGITYSEVDEQSNRVAGNLRAAGLKAGDKVAMTMPNLPEFVYAYFGVVKAGLVLVPLNPLLKGPEITYHAKDCGAKALIAFELFAEEHVTPALELGVKTYVVPFPGSDAKPPNGAHPFSELLKEPKDPDPVIGHVWPTDPQDTAVMIYTSGTTGRPKGAELTHFQLYMNCTVAGSLFGARPDDVSLGALPFFHVFGLSVVLNLSIRYGGAISVVPRFEAPAVLDAIQTDGVSVFLGVPTMFQAVTAEDHSKHDLSRLRIAVSGGSSMPGEVMRAFEKAFGIVVLEGYGLSETAAGATFNCSAEERKLLSVGKPLWGVDVRVVDDNDRPLPAGEDYLGEIVIRGHNIMKGYFGRPEATAEAMRNGWFHTGDVGYKDKDGFFFIVDRKKDLVIRGGYNVYPREIEEVLYEHPDVAEVAVIGRPDDRLGEEVVAVVVAKPGTKPTEKGIISFAKERLAAYKYPREVRFLEELPKGATGKVLKKDLRDAKHS